MLIPEERRDDAFFTALDCMPCFMRQMIRCADTVAPGNVEAKERILRECARFLSEIDLRQSPPALARVLYARMGEILGSDDPYASDKEQANARVLALLPRLEPLVMNAADPLLTALAVSITGNLIDAGVDHGFDWEVDLGRELDTAFAQPAYDAFRSRLEKGATVLIIGDNAGEIGLDTLMVKALNDLGAEVSFAVRGRPILNDATVEDARVVGMDRLCRVVDSGTDAPGAVLDRVSPEFIQEMDQADVIISKGQGNFESLYGRYEGIYFAFKAKCPVVTDMLGVELGSSMFVYR